jgi:hypothetical protein
MSTTGRHPARVPVITGDAGERGRGVFAAVSIARGTHVATLAGERVHYEDCLARVTAGTEHLDDPLQIDSRLFLDLDAFSRLFNHSCNPNLGLRHTSDLYALRDIAAGEELCYDYATTVSPTISIAQWIMRCRCGAPNCRTLIGNVLTIPAEQIQAYLHLDAFQSYMRRELDALGRVLHATGTEQA